MKKKILFLTLAILSLNSFADKAKLGQTIGGQLKTGQIAVEGQKNINGIDDKTMDLLREYNLTLRKIEATKNYNTQLAKLIENQTSEEKSILKQIDSTQVTAQEIVPLMLTMTSTLENLVKMDAPFLKSEREKRVEDLKLMMDRADVTTSEKFRRILEAYQIENDYGRTLEAYRGKVDYQGTNLTVDFLRMGRLLLVFQTLDGKRQALWNNEKKDWVELDDDFKQSIRDGLRIARKQASPELLVLPILKTKTSKI